MTKYIEILKLLVSLMPVLISAIETVERALPEKGQGASKLAVVKSMIQGAYDTAGELSVTFSEIWPTIERTIAAVVASFNLTGKFQK